MGRACGRRSTGTGVTELVAPPVRTWGHRVASFLVKNFKKKVNLIVSYRTATLLIQEALPVAQSRNLQCLSTREGVVICILLRKVLEKSVIRFWRC